MSAPVAKSGWLYRQSSVLRKWKLRWFVLTTDGYLRYFENANNSRADGALLIAVECVGIRAGAEVGNVRPPEGASEKFLFSVEATSGAKWVMCGDSEDDMRAWQLSLEQARQMTIGRPSSAPPAGARIYQPATAFPVVDDASGRYMYGYPVQSVYPYAAYPRQVFYSYDSSGQMVHVPAGQTVIYHRDNYGCRRPGTDMAFGMIAGAALGTMLWTPLLWCW